MTVETLESRSLLAAELETSGRYFSPAPTVLPEFDPSSAARLVSPVLAGAATTDEHEYDRFPELNDPFPSQGEGSSQLSAVDTFALHSRPGSKYTVFLDFDGSITEGTDWNTTSAIETLVDIAYDQDGNPSNFSNAELDEIRGIWKVVAEDFAPFDVNVTTEDPGIDALRKSGSSDATWGIRSLHTTNRHQLCDGCGGIAYVGSFSSAIDLPAYTFNKGVVAGGNTQSHEIGHTVRLGHDGVIGGNIYYSGHGSGATSWGPIMGGANAQSLRTWSNGEYFNAINQEDDLDIASTQNGFSYRSDDHGNTFATASPLQIVDGTGLSNAGVVEQNHDRDIFSFWTTAGSVSLNVQPMSSNPNLDVWAAIYDSSGNFVVESNPPSSLSASFNNVVLADGKYFLRVEGVGSHGIFNAALDQVLDPGETGYTGPLTVAPWTVANPTGYSDYASLGHYWISGTRPAVSSASVSIQALDSQKAEGNSGSTSFRFLISRTGSLDAALQLPYAVQPISLDADSPRVLPTVDGSDFVGSQLPTGFVTIPAGEESTVLQINVQADTKFELDESFRVVLAETSAASSINRSTAVATIVSDETSVGIRSVNTAMSVQPEGDPGSGATYSFTLVRRGDLSQSTSATWEVQFAGFTNPASAIDFLGGVRPTGEVVFAPGISEIPISIQLAGDLEVEPDESFSVLVTGASGNNQTSVDSASSSRRAIISEDESPTSVLDEVQFRWRQVRHSGGTRDPWAIDNVSLSTTSFADDFDPAIDSAKWQSIQNGQVNFNTSIFPGANSRELLMQGDSDRIATSIAVRPAVGATLQFDLIIGNGTGTNGNGADNAEDGKGVWLEYSVDGVYWDVLRKMEPDDFQNWTTVSVTVPPRGIVPTASIIEGNSGSSSLQFTVVRSGNLAKPASFDWRLTPVGENPIDPSDLGLSSFPSGTVNFSAGDDVKLVSIPVQGDTWLEQDETLAFVLISSNAGPVTRSTRQASVLNDDRPAVVDVILNDGSLQRSAIQQIEVRLNGLVNVSPDAIKVTNLGTDAAPTNQPVENLVKTVADVNGLTIVTLEVSSGRSLPEGNYRLDVLGSMVTARFAALTMNGDYAFGDDVDDRFYRKYGDANGNRVVDLIDFATLRRSFGSLAGQTEYLWELDVDGDNTIGLLDFAAFRKNFGT